MEAIQYNNEYVFFPKQMCFVKGKKDKTMIKEIENYFNSELKSEGKYKNLDDF